MRTDRSTVTSTTANSWMENAGPMEWRHSLPSRGLAVPLPAQEVVAADKTARFDAMIRTNGLAVYPDVVDYPEFLRSRGIHRAVVSASEHCEALVEAAGITDMFEIRGRWSTRDGRSMRGSFTADTYLAAAADLGVDATNCAVFEDAIVYLNAYRAGGFGAVVGVNRKGLPTQPFFDAGATIVVTSFEELLPTQSAAVSPSVVRPAAPRSKHLAHVRNVKGLTPRQLRVRGREHPDVVVFDLRATLAEGDEKGPDKPLRDPPRSFHGR